MLNPSGFTVQADCNGRGVNGLHNTNWVSTSTAADTTCTATKASVASTVHVITGIFGYVDLAGAVVAVKQNTTVKASVALGVGMFSHNFASPIVLTTETTANLVVTGCTALGYANMTGFSIATR